MHRSSPGFYGGLLSADKIHRQLQRGLQYALELDVVHYNGVVRIILHPSVGISQREPGEQKRTDILPPTLVACIR